MVFLVKYGRLSLSTPVLIVSTVLFGYAPAALHAAGDRSLYPDFEVQAVSDRRLIVTYRPYLSDDLTSVGRTMLYPLADREVPARALLVAVPPGGDLAFSVTYTRAGTVSLPPGENYITAAMPLVMRGSTIRSRGHQLVRLVIFPQRLEDGRLAVYKDFVIDIEMIPSPRAIDISPHLSRLDTVMAGTVINPGQYFRFGAAAARPAFYKARTSPFDAAVEWAKIAVAENGVTRISGAALQQAGFDLNSLSSDSLRLFFAGGITPPDSLQIPEPELYEVSIRLDDGGDGFFGTSDYLYFYATGPNRYDFRTGTPVYVKNYYSGYVYYWLTPGGDFATDASRWAIVDGTPVGSPDRLVTATRQPLRVEQDRVFEVSTDNHVWDYFTWYWSNQEIENIPVNLVQCLPGDSVDVIVAGVSIYTGSSVTLNGTPMSGMYLSDDYYRFWDNTGAAVPGINTIRVRLNPEASGAYLNYLDVNYPMQLRYTGGQLEFNSMPYAGILRYSVDGYTPSGFVLEITDVDHPALVSGVEIMGETAQFQRPAGPQVSRYVVYTEAAALSPVSIEKATPVSLRNDLTQADCVVISPRAFQGILDDYVSYRQAMDGYRVKLVAVEDIYDCFGYGMLSPIAIRNYLRFAYENWDPPAPFAALLVGDGHYDFLDHLGLHAPSYIPPFIWGRENSAGDDNYAYFGRIGWLDSDSSYIYASDRGWDMMIARWPVRSAAEVATQIDAVKRYESPASQGSWRSRVTFVADDEFKPNSGLEIVHTVQAESLAVHHTPAVYVHNKIYATDYPFASSGEKPSVNDAIVKAVNDGTLLLNYIGHGSPEVWADEHILKKAKDLTRMQNLDKLTVVVAGSCSIGFFDDPSKEGMAEIMFRQPGGALATVSAMRLVYSASNALFNYDLYDFIFGSRFNICEAVYAAKMLHQYGFNFSLVRNDRSYVVFGDPLGRFGLPEYRLNFDVGQDSVMTPLAPFTFTGTVTDWDGNPVVADGQIEVSVYDSRIIRYNPIGIDYSLAGPAIYRGTVEVQGGNFAGAFMVPLDIDYGGLDAQIKAYGSFADVSAIGGAESLAVAAAAAPTTDNSGPEIEYRIDGDPDFASGDLIPENATLMVALTDPSGINLTGGLGHRIELVIDNDNNATINLTDHFTYAPGSYQSGEVTYVLPDLSPQRHSFKIRAWDNANNPAVMEFDAVPSRESSIALSDVMNYPNPMEERTEFFFELSESAAWVELQIFTLAGRLIKRFRSENLPVGKNRRFSWDGRDLDGDRVAQGVYIYKITAKSRLAGRADSADTMAEAFGKLVLLN